MSSLPLATIVQRLEKTYGKSKPPALTDPWGLILWENVAYLANDERRQEAFDVLGKRIGIAPERILTASDEALLEVTSHGILAPHFSAKLRKCAETVLTDFDGDLDQVLTWPLAKAKKALRKFPGIGEPGAEKILLFARSQPILGLDSNGCRVLLRLGFGQVHKNYSTMYHLVQKAIEPELQTSYPWLIKAHQLLRRHGREMCKTTRPLCGGCPLVEECPSRET